MRHLLWGYAFLLATFRICTASAFAQPYTVQLDWQVSSDNGATWLGGNTQVSERQASVLVRLRAEWDNRDPGVYFASTQFDGLVRTPGRESADSIDMYNTGITPPWTGSFNTSGFESFRFADTLKIDDSRDSLAAGAGGRWVTPYQNPPQIPELPHPENPTILFSYRIVLDGVSGQRRISGRFAMPPSQYPSDYLTGLYLNPFPGMTTRVRTAINDASVTVIPSPAAWLVLLPAMAMQRRRQQIPIQRLRGIP